MIASLVASGFAAGMGVTPETFHVVDIPKLTIETGLKMGAIAVGCAVISIVFFVKTGTSVIRPGIFPQNTGMGTSEYESTGTPVRIAYD